MYALSNEKHLLKYFQVFERKTVEERCTTTCEGTEALSRLLNCRSYEGAVQFKRCGC